MYQYFHAEEGSAGASYDLEVEEVHSSLLDTTLESNSASHASQASEDSRSGDMAEIDVVPEELLATGPITLLIVDEIQVQSQQCFAIR